MRDSLGMPLPIEIASRESKFAAAPELLEPGEWVCLNIDTSCSWPVRPQSVEFSGHCIWIIPVTLEDYPGVAVRCSDNLDRIEATGLLHRFLSVLAWREDHGIAVVHQSGGGRPYMYATNKSNINSVRDAFDLIEIIYPTAEDARIALALMREARSLNHHGYAFLSFWRVLELAFPVSNDRIKWMEEVLPKLSGYGVREAVESIYAEGICDISRHLFESGRCAVAHANRRPIVNPDDPRDAQRLYRELPLVREMAVRAIEKCFGILTTQTEYEQHLYELRGWKSVLGVDLVHRLRSGEGNLPGENVDLPEIHVRLRECANYAPMEGMLPFSVEVDNSTLRLVYQSISGLLFIRFALDFGNERLQFDFENALFIRDDGSTAAAEHNRDCQRFIRDYLLNGEILFIDMSSNKVLSRKDAYIPVNQLIKLDACNDIIQKAQIEVDRRRLLASSIEAGHHSE